MSLRAGLARLGTAAVVLICLLSASVIFSPAASAATITQASPTSGSVTTTGSAAFTATLAAASGFVGPVTFTTSTSGFAISSGDVLGSTGALSASGSPYTVSGSDSDTSADNGSWTYSLTVTPDVIVQASPTSGSVDVGGSAAFTARLAAVSGFVGPVTFTTSTPGFAISSGDVLGSTGALSASGSPYTVSGSDSDAHGDSGSWTYSLAVIAAGTTSTSTLTQTSPTSGTVLDTMSQAFATGPITVAGNAGPVTFVTTKSSSALTVSAVGLIASTNQLSIGTY